jgi:hypothetical protein
MQEMPIQTCCDSDDEFRIAAMGLTAMVALISITKRVSEILWLPFLVPKSGY